jgi:hypothetical protein
VAQPPSAGMRGRVASPLPAGMGGRGSAEPLGGPQTQTPRPQTLASLRRSAFAYYQLLTSNYQRACVNGSWVWGPEEARVAQPPSAGMRGRVASPLPAGMGGRGSAEPLGGPQTQTPRPQTLAPLCRSAFAYYQLLTSNYQLIRGAPFSAGYLRQFAHVCQAAQAVNPSSMTGLRKIVGEDEIFLSFSLDAGMGWASIFSMFVVGD